MADRSGSGRGSWLAWLVAALLGLALLASFLPLIETNTWWVRYMDFPRLQLAIVLVVLLAAFVAARARIGRVGWTLIGLSVLALIYHAVELYPYSPLAPPASAAVEDCPPESRLTVMIANVKEKNEHADPFLALVADAEPDVLLVMETDAWWDEHLAPLAQRYPERLQHIPDEDGAFGMHLFSRLPLVAPEFRFFFDSYTPTVVTGLRLPDDSVVQFVGVHPRPPLAWSQPTTLRDGHILQAALETRGSEAASIVAGDFNAVPWEPVTRRAARIGGWLDPRIGRGFLATFDAQNILISWPLDQILTQEAFGLMDFEVLPGFGSDHYPVLARLCHAPSQALPQAAPELAPDDLEEAETSIEAARAVASADGA